MDVKRMGLIGSDHPWSKDVPGFVKEMGTFDRILRILHDDSNSLISNALWIVSKVQVTPELLHEALKTLAKYVPVLGLCVYDYHPPGGTTSIPVLVNSKMSQIELEVLETSNWVEVILHEWKTKYDVYKGPLWRVKLLPNVALSRTTDQYPHECVVVFSCSHIILDGMSYQHLFGYLLDSLETVFGNLPEKLPLNIYPCLDFYLNEEKVFLEKVGSMIVRGLVKTAFGRRILIGLGGLGGNNPYMAKHPLVIDQDPSVPIEGALLPLEFSKEDTLQIIKSCKSRSVTVHGALHTAVSIAFACLIQQGRVKSNLKLNGICSINLRFLIDQTFGDYPVGVYVLSIVLSQEITQKVAENSSEFWKLAKQCSDDIKTSIRKKDYLDLYRMMRTVLPATEGTEYNLKDFAGERYGREKVPFNITNMGKCDFLSKGNDGIFKLAARFGGGSEHNSGSIIMHNLNTFNDQLFMSIIYATHIISSESIANYAATLKDILKRNCSETEL